MALWLVGRAPDDSIAARTLVPSEPEVTAKPSEMTFAKVPSPEHRQLRSSVPTSAKAETADMSAERERANPDSSKINASPSLLQSDISSAEQQETTPSRNANMSTPRPEGAQRRETNRNSPQRFNRPNPAVAAGESSAEREPVRSTPPTREFIARGPTTPRDERKTDLSAFFQPWWYAEPARERRRNPG